MNNGRKVAEGGVLLALYSILLFLTIQLPFIGSILFFILPIPFILIALKQNMTWAFGFLFIACLLTMIFGTILSLPVALLTGLPGIVIGYHLRKNYSTIKIFISTVLVMLACIIVIFGFSVWFMNVNVITESIGMLKISVEKSSEMLAAFGKTPTDKSLEDIYAAIDLMDTLIPSMFVMTSIILSFLILLVAQPFLKRFSERKLKWPPFRELQLPKSILWYYLITMIIAMTTNPNQGDFLFTVISNLLFILQFFVLLQGLSFVFFWSHRQGWSKVIPIIIIILLLMNPVFQFIVRFLGIIDLGFPLRQNIAKKK
ncbi:YybS family protein [Peribacillus loiseleuriae]|uniref:YybS family protein n=1 Tax=Peribacillus loiseleuriae TaxID=1679170 RepID=UPI0038295DD5